MRKGPSTGCTGRSFRRGRVRKQTFLDLPASGHKGLFLGPFSYTLHTHRLVWKKLEREKLSMCTREKKKRKRRKEKEKKNFLSLLVKSLKENYFNLVNFLKRSQPAAKVAMIHRKFSQIWLKATYMKVLIFLKKEHSSICIFGYLLEEGPSSSTERNIWQF